MEYRIPLGNVSYFYAAKQEDPAMSSALSSISGVSRISAGILGLVAINGFDFWGRSGHRRHSQAVLGNRAGPW